jgi:hypothetical protein
VDRDDLRLWIWRQRWIEQSGSGLFTVPPTAPVTPPIDASVRGVPSSQAPIAALD